MKNTNKPKKRWFLKAELLILLCLIAVWVVRSGLIDIDSVKAGLLKRVVKADPVYDKTHPTVGTICVESNPTASVPPPASEEAQHIAQILQQKEQEITRLDLQLKNIDTYYLERRNNIENWYKSNLTNLQQWVEKRTKELDENERMAFAKFYQELENTVSDTTGHARVDTYATTNGYITGDYAITNSYIRTNAQLSNTTHTYVMGNPFARLEREMGQIKNLRRVVESEFVKLRSEKDASLAQLERHVAHLRTNIYVKKRDIVTVAEEKLAGGPGVVLEAIFYVENQKSCAIISGAWLFEGDEINGFRIHKILQGEVEFEKDGIIWAKRP